MQKDEETVREPEREWEIELRRERERDGRRRGEGEGGLRDIGHKRDRKTQKDRGMRI